MELRKKYNFIFFYNNNKIMKKKEGKASKQK